MNTAFMRRRSRIGQLTLLTTGLFLIAATRLVWLVARDGPALNSRAQREHMGELKLAAPRGPIVDRHGEVLALSVETRSLYAHPKKLLDASNPAQRARLAEELGLSSAELESKLKHPAPFVWLKRHLAPERAEAAQAIGLDGIHALSEYKRFYPESDLAAGVVGLAGMDGQGLSGIESQYEHLIRGEPLELSFYRDALGNPILDSPLALGSPEPGARIELTIDSEIQSLAENQLADQVRSSGARRGSAIVLDPFTGEVLALANVGADPSEAHDRLHDPAVEDAFEPGSTMKGILGAIALEDRTITPDSKIFCENGQYEIGRRVIHDHGRHGWLDLGGIIEVSSNIGAAKIALGLGSQHYYEGLRAFGVGRRSGIDLPGETAGLLRPPSTWEPIDLANHGFGQGVAVTPLQLAVAYAAIANGGLLMRPFVVKNAYDAAGRCILTHAPQVLGRAVSPDVAHQMNLLLRAVVNGSDGTGRRAQVDEFTVAGKTGTAQMINPETGGYYQSRLVASFVGFLPADDPRLVILVVLDDVNHGHFGGLVAAPVFSAIATGSLRRLNIIAAHSSVETASMLPLEGGHDSDTSDDAAVPSAGIEPVVFTDRAGSGGIPDFGGLSLRRALAIAHRYGLELEVNGAGYVIAQDPAPYTPFVHAPVKVTLASEPEQTQAQAPTAAASTTMLVTARSSDATAKGSRGPSDRGTR
ncbi:MAG: penicillin-binding protein [Candidatus Binatales bacterium]